MLLRKSRSGLSTRIGALAVVLAATTALTACAGRNERPQLVYEERPVELLYNTGYQRLERGRWLDAVAYFQEVERQHPYSEWSRRAILMQMYAYYRQGRYQDAIAGADRFIQLYPGSPSASYAFYMKAVCYFEQIVDVGRDQAATGQALLALRDVTRRYPDTPYAADALIKIDMVNDQLAGKEMAIGRWYQRQQQPLAAINRYRTVIDNQDFQRTSHTPEALYRLVELYLTLGLDEEATRNGAVLGHNYPGSRWYQDAYVLLTNDGRRPTVEPEGEREGWLRRLIPG